MERRKFVIGLGSLAAGGAAAMGTGAFTTTEASREVSVTVTDDADAYLGLQEVEDNPNSEQYFEGQDDGEAELDFSESGNDGLGVNPDAEVVFNSVFKIVNQGTQKVEVTLNGDGDVKADEDDPSDLDEDEIGIALEGGGTIGTGNDVEVNVAVNTSDGTDDLSGDLTIDADATNST